ncbi:2-C-methyl-D-erythritol 4-phosphate cytidylyltransferase [bacterium]|nr:2-C-methyl-D-erythritol 4-phosphate cytidylyltransferase [bacterium]
MTNIAIIFAGGAGKRLNSNENSIPKQFLKINEKPIIVHTLELFQKHEKIDKIYVAIHPDYKKYMKELVEYFHISKIAGIIEGGETGQDSIYNALNLAKKDNDENSLVLIHDGVRPNITFKTISRNIDCAKKNGNAITCTPCYETILISENHTNPQHVPYRKNTFSAQAPQTFRLNEIYEAHETTRKINPKYDNIVDSCTLFKTLNKPTYMIEGNRGNIKITTIEDLYLLRALIRYKEDIEAFGLTEKKDG